MQRYNGLRAIIKLYKIKEVNLNEELDNAKNNCYRQKEN
jgi:hypothetical protein